MCSTDSRITATASITLQSGVPGKYIIRMEHRSFLASLRPDERRHLTKRANAPGLARLASIALLFFLLTAGIITKVPGWPILLLGQGLLLVCQFHLLHECVHDTPFKNSGMNQWLGRIAGFLLFLPPTWFKYFHLAHHRYTQDLARDPELQSAKPQSHLHWIVHISGFTVWRAQATTLISALSKPFEDDFLPEKQQSAARREIQIMWAGYSALLLLSAVYSNPVLLWIWLVPLLLGQPFLRLYLLAEHGNCPTIANMFANTRTVFTNPVVRWFTWNMSYHTEHHVYPTVPFHNLPALHELMRDHLINTEPGYASFNREYIARLG